MLPEGIRGLGILLFCLVSGGAAELPTASSRSSDYIWQTWNREHGLPMGRIHTILQTRDGYLWVGTSAGIARFDGRQWEVFNRANTPELPGDNCTRLVESTDGQLWALVKDRLVQWTGRAFKMVTWPESGDAKAVLNVCASRAGGIWVIAEPGLWLLRRGEQRQFPLIEAIGLTTLGDVAVTSFQETEAGLWIGRARGLTRFDPFTEKFVHNQDIDGLKPPQFVVAVESDEAGTQWVLHVRGDPFKGFLSPFDGGHWRMNAAIKVENGTHAMSLCRDRRGALWLPNSAGSISMIRAGRRSDIALPPAAAADFVVAIGDDLEGGIWLGTEGNRVLRCRPTKVETIGKSQGLPHDAAWAICEARDGSMWIGTDGGLCRLREGKFTHFTEAEGLSRNLVRAVTEDADGRIWIGTGSGLNWIDRAAATSAADEPQRVHQYQFSGDWTNSKIRALVPGRNRLLWVGTARGVYSLRIGHGHAHREVASEAASAPFEVQSIYNGASGLPHEDVRALLEDRRGNLWIGTFGGGLYRLHDGQLKHYALTNQSIGDSAWVLHQDADGALWVGAEHGIGRLKGNVWRAFTARDGLPEDSVNHIVEDNFGHLWLGGERGIYRVKKSDLDQLAEGGARRIDHVTYDEDDGLLSRETNGQKNQSGAIRSQDGRLWFATTKGVAVFDPKRLPDQTTSPPVVIEQVNAGGRTIFNNHSDQAPTAEGSSTIVRGRAQSLEAALGPGGGRILEFHYTANTFVAADSVRFQYRLHGFDPEWIQAGTRRVAQYANLAPGQYRFHVLAANKYGVWNDTGAALSFTVAPFFWQTLWFKTVLFAAPLIAGYGYYRRWMTRHRRQAESERRLAVSNERADIARDLHDHLGARLTLVQHLTQRLRNGDATRGDGALTGEKLGELARELNASLDSAVWAVQPDKDTLGSLADYLGDCFQELLAPTEIELDLEFPDTLPDWPLSRAERYHLSLIAIEALNNILKHSHATAVRVRLEVQDRRFKLSIIDNGRGFANPGGKSASGHGLTNMRERIEQLGGQFEPASSPGQGTVIGLTLAPAAFGQPKSKR